MDLALPMPPQPIDRRKLASLVLAGATGAALAEVGIPVSAAGGTGLTALDGMYRMTANLAADYDAIGPVKAVQLARQLEPVATRLATQVSSQQRDARVICARLLTLSANAHADTGTTRVAAGNARIAESLAIEAGDGPSAAHAMVIHAGLMPPGDRALAKLGRAGEFAGGAPAGVMAAVAEAQVMAALGRVQGTLEAVQAAEAKHAGLPAAMWGTPGYSLGTYHPAHVKAFGGAALANVGMRGEAAPRLAEAAELARGTGLLVFVLVYQAKIALDSGDPDTAMELLTMAVARAELRPATWVVAAVANLDNRTGGAFAELVGRTAGWQFPGGGERVGQR